MILIAMGKIKLKSNNIPTNKNLRDVNDDIYCYPVTKSRNQEWQDRLRQREFGNYDDLKPYFNKVGATIVSQTDHTPRGNEGDKPTMTADELNRQREMRNVSRNIRNNTTYYWHQ
jgi:hypothetical protein